MNNNYQFFSKCDPNNSCHICTTNGINSPLEIFGKLKTQGIPLPILNKSTKKYLSYEESKTHEDRAKEKLPSRNFKEKSKPKFQLLQSRARTTIDCSECKKKHV